MSVENSNLSKTLGFALMTCMLAFGTGCGSSSDKNKSNGFRISGKLGSGFSLNGQLLGSLQLANSTEVDQIWAIPMEGMSIAPAIFNDRIVLDIASDGSFEFDPNTQFIRTDMDYVFALVNSTACDQSYEPGNASITAHESRRNCIQGYVSLPDMEGNTRSTSSDGNLYAFPFIDTPHS